MAVAASEYIWGGHRILALRGKRPHPRYHENWSWDNSFHGTLEPGSETHIRFCEVFDDPTVTGIAILIPKGYLVADIDTEDAAALFSDLAGTPKDTLIAQTTKGLHVWYDAPKADGSRWLGDRTLLFKGFGGYVAVEPSKHFTDETLTEVDGSYRWLRQPSSVAWPFEVSVLPDGIAAVFRALDTAAGPKVDPGDYDMTNLVLQFDADGWVGGHSTYRLDGLANAIENAKEGNQNNVIHWAACVARDGGVPLEAAMETLLAAALRGNHPKSRAVSTIRGAYKVRR